MGSRKGSASFAGVFVSLPVLGLLFFAVPWETDFRNESVAKRFETLSNSRRFYLLDVMANLQEFADNKVGNNTRSGLFSWHEAEREKLRAEIEKASVVVAKAAIEDDPIPKMTPDEAVRVLLQGNKNFNVILSNGHTPLTFIIERSAVHSVGQSDVEAAEVSARLKAVLAATAPPNPRADVNLPDTRGLTPLQSVLHACRTGAAVEKYRACVPQLGADSMVCGNARREIATARTEDVPLLETLTALLANGARVDGLVPKEMIHLESPDDQPRDFTNVEYARRNCPNFMADALTGRKGTPEKQKP